MYVHYVPESTIKSLYDQPITRKGGRGVYIHYIYSNECKYDIGTNLKINSFKLRHTHGYRFSVCKSSTVWSANSFGLSIALVLALALGGFCNDAVNVVVEGNGLFRVDLCNRWIHKRINFSTYRDERG